MLLEVRIVFILGVEGTRPGREHRECFWSVWYVVFLDLSMFSLKEFIELFAYDICIFCMHYTLIKRFKNKVKLHARKPLFL